MSDIVERLRETQDDWPACLVELEIEAAGEIERLREEVERLKSEESCNDVLLEYAQAETQRLREENARLREALKPFAAAAEDLDEDDKDNLPIWGHWAAGSVEIGHLRAAAAAIRETSK